MNDERHSQTFLLYYESKQRKKVQDEAPIRRYQFSTTACPISIYFPKRLMM